MNTYLQQLNAEQIVMIILALVGMVFGVVNLLWVEKTNLPSSKRTLVRVFSLGVILLGLARVMNLFSLQRGIDFLVILVSIIFSSLILAWVKKTSLLPSQKTILQVSGIGMIALSVIYIGILVYGAFTICSSGC